MELLMDIVQDEDDVLMISKTVFFLMISETILAFSFPEVEL